MTMLARQRCLYHDSREAVARCPECGHFYCRECITEHDDRAICASCLKKLTATEARPLRPRRNPWPLLQLSGGLTFAWMLFYVVGRLLLMVPDEFHNDLWQTRLMNALQIRGYGGD